ncbi:TetR family transcriptional regulator [Streptomyces xanthochromogenes]|uniref:TetR/AcrR family transcriptional regulator n=1 Tax=Streptomyces xanthochromogenes TaxID=67384 RepID=UPI00167C2061|nr:TetR/AcrR family transcriptional regulator [Streptomyces xanthochromogenes]GHB30975.1 TetR family transcriptional regulator [Streptomyces xanthochromogenes]
MGTTRTPRASWIEQGLRALATGGPDAVRIENLAQSLGVTKGGFYGYFRNRDALLTEMLDTWEYEVSDGIIAQVDRAGGDARARLERLFLLVAEAADGPVRGITADLAVRAWARHDAGVAERLRRVDNRRMHYLRSLFSEFCTDTDEVEVRCLLAVTVRIGNHFHAADDGIRSRADVMATIRKRLLS